jgi:hypothetical protein
MHAHVLKKQKIEKKKSQNLKWQLLMFKRYLAVPFSHTPDFQLVCVIIEFSWGLQTLIYLKMFLELYNNKPSNSKPSKPFY